MPFSRYPLVKMLRVQVRWRCNHTQRSSDDGPASTELRSFVRHLRFKSGFGECKSGGKSAWTLQSGRPNGGKNFLSHFLRLFLMVGEGTKDTQANTTNKIKKKKKDDDDGPSASLFPRERPCRSAT